MIKLLPLILFTCCSIQLFAQNDILVLKKHNETMSYFYQGSDISFQLKNKEWVKGFITKIANDSFGFTKVIVRIFLGGSDTTVISGYHYAISDVYAVPKKGVQIDFIAERFRISTTGGHQHWYWIKGGWIFMGGAAGYALLNVANGLAKNNFSFSGTRLTITAGVFLAGLILHYAYKQTYRMGDKYHLETMKIIGK